MNLVKLAQEAVSIGESRKYVTRSGRINQLPKERGSTYHPPDQPLRELPQRRRDTVIEVTEESTLACLGRHRHPVLRIAALNFASAKNPGGGFLRGTKAQEESIARASTLYAGIKGSPYYEANTFHPGLYTDGIIWSPEVWVFRDDHGFLLDEPYSGAFITSPAVNHNSLRSGDLSQVQAVMVRRGRRILEVASHYMVDTLILGAWGCGVFGNDPSFVAQMFANHLNGDFNGVFGKVVFPIYGGGGSHRAFKAVFK